MKLDAKDQDALGNIGVDMDAVANVTKAGGNDLEVLTQGKKVVRGELWNCLARVARTNHDGNLDLTLELVEQGSVLTFGNGEVVAGDVLDDEAVLFEDVLALSGVAKVIVAKVDTLVVHGDAVDEARILVMVSKVK